MQYQEQTIAQPERDFLRRKVRSFLVHSLLTVTTLVGACSGETTPHKQAPQVVLETDLGRIVLVLDPRHAPLSVANFLRYVDEDRYREAAFYRVVRMDNQPRDKVKIEVIQGGLGFAANDLRLSPIRLETTRETGIPHRDGTISMARLAPDSASSEFFICIGDQPELNFGGRRNPDGQGFAAFGRVIEGMDVVRKIQAQPANGQVLRPPVRITAVRRWGEN